MISKVNAQEDMAPAEDNFLGLNRWRLILGRFSEPHLQLPQGGLNDKQLGEMDETLEFLYGREYGEQQGARAGGTEASNLTVPSWITKIRKLFPQKTVEVLEKHAIQRYQLTELLTDRETLEKLEPNQDLLKTILSLKHLMKGEVLTTARRIVQQVADELTKKLSQEIRNNIMGRLDRQSSGGTKSARNLDFRKTIRRNLRYYDHEQGLLGIEKVYFHRRVRVYNPWQVIILVDESGSMLDSVIHSAVMAGIFSRLPALRTNLVIFDTEVVDLSRHVDDPVQTLMSIQLGGGTDIGKALQYALTLLENPQRTMVILVSDLCEGASYSRMYSHAQDLLATGARLLALTSLDRDAFPAYNKNAAENLVALGAQVAALTPEELAKWIGRIIA